MTATAVNYLRLRAEREFLGAHEPLPPFGSGEERLAVTLRNQRRLVIDNQLADLEIARLKQERFELMAAQSRQRDGW